ncbi:MAG: glucose-1-phosphate cytidylyltransferase [Lachnospiraceae bacterium]|nr:glucose-1-phosphate cytidylyltransferase [Lachnospiraceae bacterium]
MKVVILAGGKGSRISEESVSKPKPMVELKGKPILWHIMKIYSHYGYHDFIICCGYKGHMIKEYFINYHMYQTDTTFDLQNKVNISHRSIAEPWKITLADTGLEALTADRIKKIRDYLTGDEDFMLTYGDGVSDVNIPELIKFHRSHGKVATITATQPAGRFGAIKISDLHQVKSFKEKARKDQSWVNMGFMVLNKRIFDYLGDGSEMLEAGPFERLAAAGQMMAYQHQGFWSPMDTMHDKAYLEGLLDKGQAPWQILN